MQMITQTGARTGSRRTVRVLANVLMAGLVTGAAMLGIGGTAAAVPTDVTSANGGVASVNGSEHWT